MKKTISAVTEFKCDYELIDDKFCVYNIFVSHNPLLITNNYYGICETSMLDSFLNSPNIEFLNKAQLFIKNQEFGLLPIDFDLNSNLSEYENKLEDSLIYIKRNFETEFSISFEELVSFIQNKQHQIILCLDSNYLSPHLLDLHNNLLYYQAKINCDYTSLERDQKFNDKIVNMLLLQKQHHLFTQSSFEYWLDDYSHNIVQTINDGFISLIDLKPMVVENEDYPTQYNLLVLNNISSSLANDCFQLACKAYYSVNDEIRFDNTLAITNALIFELSGANQILNLNLNTKIKKITHNMNDSQSIIKNLNSLLLDYRLNNELILKKSDGLKIKI